MEFNEVKAYIDKIKDSDRFKKLDEFIKMTQIKPNKDMYENIAYYVSRFHPIRNIKEFFQPDYPYFIKFLEYYLDNQPVQMPLREDGYIDLINTLYLVQPGIFSGNKGNFLDHYMMMTDGSIYISKLPLILKKKENFKIITFEDPKNDFSKAKIKMIMVYEYDIKKKI